MTDRNQILQGDCTEILRTMPGETADLIVTDPPYFVRYTDRSGRSIANDSDPASVLGAFDELYRVLKPDTYCVSFYGWSKLDAFANAWRAAGFMIVGHIVFHKRYASRSGYLNYRHEQACVLAKGRPEKPAQPIDDVQPWKYSGNKSHPTQKAVGVLKPLIESFSKPGDLVLDPFAGSGSTLVAATVCGRRSLGIELEASYCDIAAKRIERASRYMASRSP